MKRTISKIIAFICYYIGIDAIFYHLNRQAKRIITFHDVLPAELLPVGTKIGLSDTEKEFRMKVRIIKKHFLINTNIEDTNSAVITFDDGYKNQQEVAGRILKEEGDIPAIIFAAGRMIDNNNPNEALVVDLLLHWTWLAPDGKYKSLFSDFVLTANNRQSIWQNYIWKEFCKDSEQKGNRLLNLLEEQYTIEDILSSCNSEYLRLRLTGISNTDIAELMANGWLVGWHTQEHYPLSKLSRAEKRIEITSVPENMKNIVFSYPYGELDSVDEESVRIARDYGFTCAVSNVEHHSKLIGKYFVPRMMLDGNFYQCNMQLSGLKYFLKTRKLLPVLQ